MAVVASVLKKVILWHHVACVCVRACVHKRRRVHTVCVRPAQRVAAHQFHLAQRGNWPPLMDVAPSSRSRDPGSLSEEWEATRWHGTHA